MVMESDIIEAEFVLEEEHPVKCIFLVKVKTTPISNRYYTYQEDTIGTLVDFYV